MVSCHHKPLYSSLWDLQDPSRECPLRMARKGKVTWRREEFGAMSSCAMKWLAQGYPSMKITCIPMIPETLIQNASWENFNKSDSIYAVLN